MFDPWLGKFYMPCGVAKKKKKDLRSITKAQPSLQNQVCYSTWHD